MTAAPRHDRSVAHGRRPGGERDPQSAPQRAVIRLLLLGGERLFLEALGTVLDADPRFSVVATVVDPEDGARALRRQFADVAVVSVGGPGGIGPESMAALCPEGAELRLVALAETDDAAVLVRAVKSGFRAWVPKVAGLEALTEVLPAVCRGETRIPPMLLTRLLSRLLDEEEERRAAEATVARLTPREREILEALVRGGTRDEIADELAISANTVRTHVQNVLAKLGVHTALAAVTVARRAGMG